MIVVGRAGLAADRAAHAERARRRAGAALDDVAQHAGHLERDRPADELLALDRPIEHLAPARSKTLTIAARPRDLPAAGKHRVGRGQIERRHEAGAERERRHVGQLAEPGVGREPQHGARSDVLLQIGGGRVVRLEQRGAQRQRVGLLALARCAGSTPDRSGAVTWRRFDSTDTGE